MTSCEKIRFVGAIGLALASLILMPCEADTKEAPSPAEVSAPSGAAPSQLPQQDFPEPVLSSLRAALRAYEEVRGELAADRLEGVPASASRLAGALRLTLDDRAGLGEQIPAIIEQAALAAESIGEAEDLTAARVAFSEVSRRVLLLGSSDPRLTEGWHVFACPMAETFGQWIQSTEALENPYMGQAMPRCGSPIDWSVSALASVEEARSSAQEGESQGGKEATRAEPEFKPGIPGIKMVDVRDHKFLWREIDELQKWERADRLSVAEYRSKVIEKTTHFLGLDEAAADAFATTASEAVVAIRESFFQKRRASEKPSNGPTQFSSDLRAAATRVTSRLQQEPRHQLFTPECKKWLLKLAFGPREAKEAKETRQAQADKSGKPDGG